MMEKAMKTKMELLEAKSDILEGMFSVVMSDLNDDEKTAKLEPLVEVYKKTNGLLESIDNIIEIARMN